MKGIILIANRIVKRSKESDERAVMQLTVNATGKKRSAVARKLDI